MLRNDYPASSYPDQWRILGQTLRPFSFGHYLKLRRFGNAYVSDEKSEATLGDLLTGVAVCKHASHPDPEKDPFWSWYNQPVALWRRLFPTFADQFSPMELWCKRLGRNSGPLNLSEKADLFRQYIESQTQLPAYWTERVSERESGAHWSQQIITALVAYCGYTEMEVYNCPMGKGLLDFFKYAENEGAVTLMSREEVELENGAV